MPLHVGIIPDGNRRYCQENNISLTELIDNIYKNIINLFSIIYNIENYKFDNIKDITELSLYLMSYDNLTKRDDRQIKIIFELIESLCEYIHTCVDVTHKQLFQKINLQIIGRVKALPKNLQTLIYKIDKLNNDNKQNASKLNTNLFNITVAIAYDPEQDMYNIVNNIDKRTQTPIDLIIRTSGEKRLSGFFPCHSLYSELLFLNNYWPEIDLHDIDESINIYYKRNRRFGK